MPQGVAGSLHGQVADQYCRKGLPPCADEGSGNESSSELEWRQEWDADSSWRPWAVHADPIGASP